MFRFKDNRLLSEGQEISPPKPPFDIVGAPARIRSEKWRNYRKSYDWAIYDADQLAVMEAYWDRCVSLYLSLLPERFAANPSKYYGINLGTFNGVFQKAWMRLGFRMYGVELHDVVHELHAYGCEGERANFFDLYHIKPGTFDFAILDRVIFNKPESCGFVLNEETGLYTERKAGVSSFTIGGIQGRRGMSDIKISVPPFFNGAFHLLKEDGAFLAILYNNWSEEAIRELYSAGAVTLRRDKRRQPYLYVTVDRSGAASPFPTVEGAARILRGCKGPAALSIAAQDPNIGKTVECGAGNIKFHHLPTNHLVELQLATGTIVSDEIFLNDPEAAQFFGGENGLIKVAGGTAGVNSSPVIFLFDKDLMGGDPRHRRWLRGRRIRRQVLCHCGITMGSRSLATVVPEVANEIRCNEALAKPEVIIGVGDLDCIPNPSTGMAMYTEAEAKQALEFALRQLGDVGAKVTVLLPRPVIPQAETSGLENQRAVVESYRQMVERLSASSGFNTVDWGDPLVLDNVNSYRRRLRGMARAAALAQEAVAYLSENIAPVQDQNSAKLQRGTFLGRLLNRVLSRQG